MAKQKRPEIDYSNAGAARVAIRAPSDSAGFRASVERTAVAQTASADAIADHVDQAVDPDPHTQYVETTDLGDCATLDVGTTAGTVAAGDDDRFLPDGMNAGDILYWNGTGWAVLASGTGVLTNDGAGNLTWETP